MAFTYCENCGEKIDFAETKCPHCGYVRGGEYVPPETDRNENEPPLWKTPDNAAGRGQYVPPFYGNPYMRYRPRIKRPVSKGLIVFSAINIFLGLFCLVGMIFGSLALAQAIGAQHARTDTEEVNKKKTALILNIIGTALTVINIAAFVIAFVMAGAGAPALALIFI
jgi:hypothetical protein